MHCDVPNSAYYCKLRCSLYYLSLNHSKFEALVLWENAFPLNKLNYIQVDYKPHHKAPKKGIKRRKTCGRWEEDCQPALGYPFHSWPLGDKPMRFFRVPLNSSWLMLAERPCLWNVQVTQRLWGKPPEIPGDVCDWINNLSVKALRLLMGCPWIDCQGVCRCKFAEWEFTWASAAARFCIKLKCKYKE